MPAKTENIIELKDIKMHFPVTGGFFGRQKGTVKAVDGISLNVKRGETIGLVGESGCGKTTTGRCMLMLNKPTGGEVLFDGECISGGNKKVLSGMRTKAQMISQDPFSSLDPRQTVGSSIGEGIVINKLLKGSAYTDRIRDLLEMVGLNPGYADRYPHEFSGGQRQRISIARSLAIKPELIVCDEPVSALDVSIQALIIKLLMKLKEELKLTYIFIGHDLSVVRYISDRIAVIYLGRIVELTKSENLYENPLHPYTQALLSAVPIPNPSEDKIRKRIMLSGDVPSPMNPPSGCNFSTRCIHAQDICREKDPELKAFGDEHWAACHFAQNL